MSSAQSKLMIYAAVTLIIGLIIGGIVGYFAGTGAVKTVTSTITKAVTVTVTKTITTTAVPTPTGEIILTVRGKILKTNKDGTFIFDLDMLKSLGTLTYKEYDPWFKKELEYTGVPLVKVLEFVGVAKDATKVTVMAKDKYKVVFNLKALMESEVGRKILLAFMVNGKPLRPVFKFEIDAGGPLRLAYPYLKGQEDVKKEVEEKLLIGVWDGKGKALGKKFAPAHEWMVCEIIVE